MEQKRRRSIITMVRTSVAPLDCVALRTTSMYGCPVGEFSAAFTSPTVNIKVIVMTKART